MRITALFLFVFFVPSHGLTQSRSAAPCPAGWDSTALEAMDLPFVPTRTLPRMDAVVAPGNACAQPEEMLWLHRFIAVNPYRRVDQSIVARIAPTRRLNPGEPLVSLIGSLLLQEALRDDEIREHVLAAPFGWWRCEYRVYIHLVSAARVGPLCVSRIGAPDPSVIDMYQIIGIQVAMAGEPMTPEWVIEPQRDPGGNGLPRVEFTRAAGARLRATLREGTRVRH